MPDTEDDSMFKFFDRHLVGIAGTQLVGSPRKSHTFLIAGFVVSVSEHWFLITAGHCLEQLDAAIEHTSVESINLIDSMGEGAIDHTPIYFDYREAPKQYFHDEIGIDCGFIYLRPYYKSLLKANGVVALDEIQWKRQPDTSEFDVCWMLGLPTEFIDNSDSASVLFRTAFFPLDAVIETPEPFKRDSPTGLPAEDAILRDGMFYGKIHEDIDLPKDDRGRDDIRGMSGGPIFGFARRGEALKYWLIAAQSCWFRDSRYVRGFPVPLIASYLEDLIHREQGRLNEERPGDK